jgi:hypothetical protein
MHDVNSSFCHPEYELLHATWPWALRVHGTHFSSTQKGVCTHFVKSRPLVAHKIARFPTAAVNKRFHGNLARRPLAKSLDIAAFGRSHNVECLLWEPKGEKCLWCSQVAVTVELQKIWRSPVTFEFSKTCGGLLGITNGARCAGFSHQTEEDGVAFAATHCDMEILSQLVKSTNISWDSSPPACTRSLALILSVFRWRRRCLATHAASTGCFVG